MRTISALLLLAPAAILAQTERYPVSGSDVAIYNLVGELRAEAGSGSDVVVEVTRAGADAAKLTIGTGTIRGRNTLRVIYPDDRIVYRGIGRNSNTTLDVNDDGTFNDEHRGGHRVKISGSGSGLDASANLKVLIPSGKRVKLNLGVGEVWINNVNGDLTVDVDGANVTTANTKGSLNLDTGSGEVKVTNAEGRVDLDSGSGDVTINGVKGPTLHIDSGSGEVTADNLAVDRLDLDSGSGSVKLSGVKAREIKLDSGSGDVDLGLTADIEDLELDSGSGGVTIRIPATLGAQLDIDAGSGGVKTEMQIKVTHYESDRLIGTIGDGKGRIHIDSGSGTVRLVKND